LTQPFLTDVSGKNTFETVPTQVRKNFIAQAKPRPPLHGALA